eukprot:4942827-Heterocapsa_arctica.AAC.1
MAIFLEKLIIPPTIQPPTIVTDTTSQPSTTGQPSTPIKPPDDLSELSEMDENVGENVWQGPPTADDNPTPWWTSHTPVGPTRMQSEGNWNAADPRRQRQKTMVETPQLALAA